MNRINDSAAAIHALSAEAGRAAQAGNEDQLVRIWARILELDANHLQTLTDMGQYAFRKGNHQAARTAFQRVADSDGRDVQQWINVALACRALGDDEGELEAIRRGLVVDPSDLLCLVLRGNLFERQGRTHQAARAYGAAATVSPPLEQLHPELRPAVLHARQFHEKYNDDMGKFLDGFLDPSYRELSGERLDRFRTSVDIMLGRKRRFDAMPVVQYYPGLPAIEFFDRQDFPWLDPFEASTDAIRDEFLNVLKQDEGFTPYISYPDDMPLNQWAELNNSPRWSAFHLFKNGTRLDGNADRCPLTMSLLAQAPQPLQSGRTPAAMFSLLKPKTHIPPHTGVSNVRMVVHVPLIVPEGCGFRCGNETRIWEPGKAFVFDDTIDHEAWNTSDKLRVVLIFDIWNPLLSAAERSMLTSLATGLNQFTDASAEFDL